MHSRAPPLQPWGSPSCSLLPSVSSWGCQPRLCPGKECPLPAQKGSHTGSWIIANSRRARRRAADLPAGRGGEVGRTRDPEAGSGPCAGGLCQDPRSGGRGAEGSDGAGGDKPPGRAGPLASAMRAVSRPLQPLTVRGGRGCGQSWSFTGACLTPGSATLPCRQGNHPRLLSPGASFSG